MKTIRLSFLCVALFAATSAMAHVSQETPQSDSIQTRPVQKALKILRNFSFEYGFSYGTRQHHLSPMTTGFQISYEIVPRLSVAFRTECLWAHYKEKDVRRYYKNRHLAGGISLCIAGGKQRKRDGDPHGSLDLRMLAGGSVGNAGWKQAFYDGSLVYYYRGKTIATPTLSVGYRFTDSKTSLLPNTHTCYFSAGISF